ncbi:MAG: hypothetical protein J7L19_03725 [Dehalococcoidia bacterium]|nr:hypothetical protein [Dehalococcoidia bacterium]
MWRKKKLIIAAVLAIVVLIGVAGGSVLAQNGNGSEIQFQSQRAALLDRVCEIYEENTGTTIDQEELRDAFAQATSEMQNEAIQNRLQRMVQEGRMTQGEADQCLEWWQARPDVAARFGLRNRRD